MQFLVLFLSIGSLVQARPQQCIHSSNFKPVHNEYKKIDIGKNSELNSTGLLDRNNVGSTVDHGKVLRRSSSNDKIDNLTHSIIDADKININTNQLNMTLPDRSDLKENTINRSKDKKADTITDSQVSALNVMSPSITDDESILNILGGNINTNKLNTILPDNSNGKNESAIKENHDNSAPTITETDLINILEGGVDNNKLITASQVSGNEHNNHSCPDTLASSGLSFEDINNLLGNILDEGQLIYQDNSTVGTTSTVNPIDSDYFERLLNDSMPRGNFTEDPNDDFYDIGSDEEPGETEPIEPLDVSSRNAADPCSYRFLDQPITINKKGKRVSQIQCEHNMWKYKYEVLEVERKSKECLEVMRERNDNTSMVIGGRKAGHAEFPHMGALGWRVEDAKNEYIFMCGSSLISTRFAITAAHCSAITDDLRLMRGLARTIPDIVRFGSISIETEKASNNTLLFHDAEIDGPLIRLKKYKFKTKHNDVALIKFVREVQIQHNVRPACIWNGYLRGHTEGNVTGWGKTSSASDTQSSHLLYATLDFIDSASCDTMLNHYKSGSFLGIMGHQFCAGKLSGGIDTCQGDSGGPLQIQLPMPSEIDKDGTMHHIVGVTSFGKGCGLRNSPGVYANISDPNILCWIEKTVWPDEKNRFCRTNLFEGY